MCRQGRRAPPPAGRTCAVQILGIPTTLFRRDMLTSSSTGSMDFQSALATRACGPVIERSRYLVRLWHPLSDTIMEPTCP